MAIKFPNFTSKGSFASTPKARVGDAQKTVDLWAFPGPQGVQHCTLHYTPHPGPIPREPGAPGTAPGTQVTALGEPLTLAQVARLIGCSPWTVRQTLIPRGLPHFRFKASGRLTFYKGQVIRWIERQQQIEGGKQHT